MSLVQLSVMFKVLDSASSFELYYRGKYKDRSQVIYTYSLTGVEVQDTFGNYILKCVQCIRIAALEYNRQNS